MKRILSLLLLQFLCFRLTVSAQTVSPIIVECGKKCRGEFSITNNGLTPLAVSVQARSFSLDIQGRATNRPLDAGVDLQLVYSDSQGKFFARMKHDKPAALAVLLQQFAAPGR
jgi:hypothetical protein